MLRFSAVHHSDLQTGPGSGDFSFQYFFRLSARKPGIHLDRQQLFRVTVDERESRSARPVVKSSYTKYMARS
jgi:hypothetical protein